jgi:hypothetical protein
MGKLKALKNSFSFYQGGSAMKFLTVLAGVLLIGNTAAASVERGVPSRARLAEMGLADMVILSDREALTIRVYGRPPNRWGNLYPYIKGVSRLDRQLRLNAPGRTFFR